MLKGINPIVSPELLKALCEMGHGDELVIADGNFPCESIGKNASVQTAIQQQIFLTLFYLSFLLIHTPKNPWRLWKL